MGLNWGEHLSVGNAMMMTSKKSDRCGKQRRACDWYSEPCCSGKGVRSSLIPTCTFISGMKKNCASSQFLFRQKQAGAHAFAE